MVMMVMMMTIVIIMVTIMMSLIRMIITIKMMTLTGSRCGPQGVRAECQKALNLPKATEQNIAAERKKIRDVEQKLGRNMANEKADKLRVYSQAIDCMLQDAVGTIGLCEMNAELKVN